MERHSAAHFVVLLVDGQALAFRGVYVLRAAPPNQHQAAGGHQQQVRIRKPGSGAATEEKVGSLSVATLRQ